MSINFDGFIPTVLLYHHFKTPGKLILALLEFDKDIILKIGNFYMELLRKMSINGSIQVTWNCQNKDKIYCGKNVLKELIVGFNKLNSKSKVMMSVVIEYVMFIKKLERLNRKCCTIFYYKNIKLFNLFWYPPQWYDNSDITESIEILEEYFNNMSESKILILMPKYEYFDLIISNDLRSKLTNGLDDILFYYEDRSEYQNLSPEYKSAVDKLNYIFNFKTGGSNTPHIVVGITINDYMKLWEGGYGMPIMISRNKGLIILSDFNWQVPAQSILECANYCVGTKKKPTCTTDNIPDKLNLSKNDLTKGCPCIKSTEQNIVGHNCSALFWNHPACTTSACSGNCNKKDNKDPNNLESVKIYGIDSGKPSLPAIYNNLENAYKLNYPPFENDSMLWFTIFEQIVPNLGGLYTFLE